MARRLVVGLDPHATPLIFEIAEPGKDFEVYSRSKLTRAQ